MSEQLPSRRKALQLLKKSGCSQQVIQHCRVVATLATEIAEICQKKGHNVDIELVQIGALLHDIGRAKTHSVDHAVVGAKIAESFGLPDSVVLIIERHVGGGVDREEAKKLGWPPKSYIPQTLEQKIVAYADKRIEGSRSIPIERTIERLSEELGGNHPSVERLRKLHEEFLSWIENFDSDNHFT